MNGKGVLSKLNDPAADETLLPIYGPEGLEFNRLRYQKLVEELLDHATFSPASVPDGEDVRLYTAPGRTELGGNHTDHNHGKVFAASINLDVAAAAVRRHDRQILFRSTGFADVSVDISNLHPRPEEKGTTGALIRGIAAASAEQGTELGGFTVNADSRVFPGSGLSSSAAVESLFGKIIDDLYGQGNCSSLDIAKIGQFAENTYFGKPCGLMDQIACATGGAVKVDFIDEKAPLIESIAFDPEATGFLLCIINTRGSHADLTPDYAAIPEEMKSVARFLGRNVLREVTYTEVILRGNEIRKTYGDRAFLRAIHYFDENQRVDAMVNTSKKIFATSSPGEKYRHTRRFLDLVNKSGDSSWELLQNVYTEKNPQEQGLGVALALTHDFLRRGAGNGTGACRVHGGGFAGTIQAYIPSETIKDYKRFMEQYFGEASVTVLRIRGIGAARLDL